MTEIEGRKEANETRFRNPPILSDAGYEVTLDGITVRSDLDKIVIDGELVLRRDRKSLQRAETLKILLEAFWEQIANDKDLPERAQVEQIIPGTPQENSL